MDKLAVVLRKTGPVPVPAPGPGEISEWLDRDVCAGFGARFAQHFVSRGFHQVEDVRAHRALAIRSLRDLPAAGPALLSRLSEAVARLSPGSVFPPGPGCARVWCLATRIELIRSRPWICRTDGGVRAGAAWAR